MTVRVMIVDDQELVRTGFRMILEADEGIEVAGEAPDGLVAIREAERLRPDVVLMDVRMPGLNGIEATRRLAEVAPASRVLVLTTFDLDEYVYDALEAGASGFLLKDVGRDELTRAVRVIASGEALLAPTVTRRLLADFVHNRPRSDSDQGSVETLTPREHDTLLLLARGMSNAEIASALVVSEHTVKTHVGNVFAKLGLRDRIHAVIYAYEHGVVAPGE